MFFSGLARPVYIFRLFAIHSFFVEFSLSHSVLLQSRLLCIEFSYTLLPPLGPSLVINHLAFVLSHFERQIKIHLFFHPKTNVLCVQNLCPTPTNQF